MRYFLTAMFVALALASAANAAGKAWDFVVGPPTAAEPLPAGAKARSISLTRAFVDMPSGRQWATVWWCCNTIGREVISWEGGRSNVDTSELAPEFDSVLGESGFSEGPKTDLFASGAETELQVGAIVRDVAGRLCSGCGITTPADQFKGAVEMSVEWQIYSPLERKIVLTVKTTGAYEAQKSLPGISHIMNGAFRENTHRLLNSPDFRALLIGSLGAPANASPRTVLAPLALSTVKAKPRRIPDCLNAVVTVFSNGGAGSGFLVTPDGYVLTNQHVVGSAQFVKLRWSDGTETLGEVVRADARRDVALIKAEASVRTPLALRATASQLGEAVYAIGTPLDVQFQNTLTKGIVSATRVRDGQLFIQSDAAITRGNSGGPLLDESGSVVGIAVSGVEPNGASANINFFIPIADALKALALQPAT